MKIEIYSDLACPWCYIGKRRLERELETFAHKADVELEWKSFELAPDMPAVSPLSVLEYLTSAKGMTPQAAQEAVLHVTALGAAEDLDLRFDQVKLSNTRMAHALLHYAKSVGRQAEMNDRLFSAAFTEGRELGDVAVLIHLAGQVGLDMEEVRDVLTEGRYEQAVQEDEANAHNISGVPLFIFNGKYSLAGAQGSDAFRRALETAWKQETAMEHS